MTVAVVGSLVLGLFAWALDGDSVGDDPSNEQVQAYHQFRSLPKSEQSDEKLLAGLRVTLCGAVPALVGVIMATGHTSKK
jgi:hypothetical protein